MCQCCMVWATSEAWIKCSKTMVALRFLAICSGSCRACSSVANAFAHRTFRSAPISEDEKWGSQISKCEKRRRRKNSTPVSTACWGWDRGIRTFVHYISGHDWIYNELSEASVFCLVSVNGTTQLFVLVTHQNFPSQIKWILLCNACILVDFGKRIVLIDQGNIWYSRMVHIMDQSRKHSCKLSEVIARNSFMFLRRQLC